MKLFLPSLIIVLLLVLGSPVSCELQHCWKGTGTCRNFCTPKEIFFHFCKDNSMCCVYSFMTRKPKPKPEPKPEPKLENS